MHAHLCGSWRARISGNGEIYNAPRQIRLRYVLLTVLPRNLHIHICKWRGANVEPIDQSCNSRQNGKYASVNVDEVSRYSSNDVPLVALIKSVLSSSSNVTSSRDLAECLRDRTRFRSRERRNTRGSSFQSIFKSVFLRFKDLEDRLGLARNGRCDDSNNIFVSNNMYWEKS